MANGIPLSFFLNREQIEKIRLARTTFLGVLFGFEFLRELRVRVLRERAIQATNCGADHENNGDEAKFQTQSFVGAFTKGLPHADTGLIADADQFKRFRIATHKGDFFSDGLLQLASCGSPLHPAPCRAATDHR